MDDTRLITRTLQNNDLLGVRKHSNISIVGDDDDLAALLSASKNRLSVVKTSLANEIRGLIKFNLAVAC